MFLSVWDSFWNFPVSAGEVLLLRFALFGLSLWFLASRTYEYLALAPRSLFDPKYANKRFETLMWLPPTRRWILVVHLGGMSACCFGLLGVLVPICALLVSFSLVYLDHLSSMVTTPDLEILPFAIGMWALPFLHNPTTWHLWHAGEVAVYEGFGFRFIQLYLVSIYVVNGITKLKYWRSWVLKKGIWEDIVLINTRSPLMTTKWRFLEGKSKLTFLWSCAGIFTIAVESLAPLAFFGGPVTLVWLIFISMLHGGIWWTRSTSFLMFIPLAFVAFFPSFY